MNIEDFSSAAPIIHISDNSGKEIQRIVLKVQGAGLIRLLDNRFARSGDGYIAVGGRAYGNDSSAGFLVIISPDGSNRRVIRTEPYVPYTVAFAADGTIWAAGLENDSSGKDKGMVEYSILRRFPTSYTPVEGSMLVASKNTIGWLVPVAHHYFEFSLTGEPLHEFAMAETT